MISDTRVLNALDQRAPAWFIDAENHRAFHMFARCSTLGSRGQPVVATVATARSRGRVLCSACGRRVLKAEQERMRRIAAAPKRAQTEQPADG